MRDAVLREALEDFIYQTTHLSAREDDGSHWCKIPADTLAKARAALSPPAGGGEEVSRSQTAASLERATQAPTASDDWRSRVAEILDDLLHEDSDKSEQARTVTRLRAKVLLADLQRDKAEDH